MAVSKDDVRHIGAPPSTVLRVGGLSRAVAEPNGVLGPMAGLERVSGAGGRAAAEATCAGMPLRAAQAPAVPLHHARHTFAPKMIDGFFLVPRLATHEDSGEAS